MNTVYIVTMGESSEGRSVKAVRARLDEAIIAANLLMDPQDMWVLIRDERGDRVVDEGDSIMEWNHAVDNISIERWYIR